MEVLVAANSLMHVAHYGKTEVVEALIKAEADIEATDNKEWTVLMHAAYGGEVDAVTDLCLQGADIDATNENGITALMIAAGQGKTEVVEALLNMEADAEATDDDGKSALTFAAEQGKVEAARMLILHGVDGVKTLMAFKGRRDGTAMRAVETLLKAGATLLPELARKASPDLKRWINAGADKVKDEQGKIALMHVVDMAISDSEKTVQALKALLRAGGDATIQDNEGMTAEDHAARMAAGFGIEEILRPFEKRSFWMFWA